MMTVDKALNEGWSIVEAHLTVDHNIALLSHKRQDGLWEYGFAIWHRAG